MRTTVIKSRIAEYEDAIRDGNQERVEEIRSELASSGVTLLASTKGTGWFRTAALRRPRRRRRASSTET